MRKTTVSRIGSLVNSDAKLYTQKTLAWSNEPIKMLGGYLSCSGDNIDSNFNEVIKKLNQVCDNWYNRTLTIIGKITLINILMGSLFVYKMSTLMNMTNNQLNTATQIIQNFLWNGK